MRVIESITVWKSALEVRVQGQSQPLVYRFPKSMLIGLKTSKVRGKIWTEPYLSDDRTTISNYLFWATVSKPDQTAKLLS